MVRRKVSFFWVNTGKLRALGRKGAHHAHAGEVFLYYGGKLALGLVRFQKPGLYAAEIHKAARNEKRKEARRKRRHPAADGQHDGKGRHGHAHRAHHLYKLHLHKAAHCLHIAGAALDDVARLYVFIIGIRHGLQVLEQPVAQAAREPLAKKGHGVAAQVGKRAVYKAYGHYGKAHQPQVGRKACAPAEGVCQRLQKARQGHGLCADDAVHREGDDKRHKVRRDGRDGGGRHAQRQPAPKPAEQPGQQFFTEAGRYFLF